MEQTSVRTSGLRHRMRVRWRKVRIWAKAFWSDVRPGREAKRGAIIGVAALVLLFAGYLGLRIRAGLGTWLDFAACLVAACLLLPLGALLLWLALRLLASLPRWVAGFLVAAWVLMSVVWHHPLPGTVLVLVSALLGATIASLFFGRFRRMALSRRIITVTLFLVALAANAGMGFLLWTEGKAENLAYVHPAPLPPEQQLQLPDPGQPGPFPVRTLTYGSGTDRRRPEYGAGAQLKTKTVDGSSLLKDIKGWKGKIRTWYWGFDTSKLPLNGRVWYPEGGGPYPLVLVVHGNHQAQEFSDPGYAYLGELLASRGYILVSVDENFLNNDWLGGYRTAEHPARAWLLLEHLEVWRGWNESKDSPFFGKADLGNVALIGHSRGGEAAATAAVFNRLRYYPDDATVRFDYNFGIRSVVAIAPSDGQYKPAGMWRPLRDVSYFVLQGGYDADVSSFLGGQQYKRTTFSEGFPGFKAALYVYRANHGQFNSVWGRWDSSPPVGWLLNLKPLIGGEEQRRIAAVCISAFLEATLRGRREYIPMFQDYRRAAAWLPDTVYVNRFQDATFRTVCDFEEDADVTSTTLAGGTIRGADLAVWKEQRIPFRNGSREDNAVSLGWREAGRAGYTIQLPSGFARQARLDANTVFEFALADAGEEPPPPKGEEKKEEKKDTAKKKEPLDLSIELATGGGQTARLPLSRFGPLYAPLTAKFLKFKPPGGSPYGKDAEPVLHRYALPLSAFGEANPSAITAIRFVFDRSPNGVVVIDDIGFSRQ